MGYIYLVTNNINQKKYVGQSICKDINLRWNQHKRKDGKTLGKHLLNAYNKYGIENFSYSIICICFDEDCNKYEQEYIRKYNTLAPNGYNLTSGSQKSNPYPKKSTKEKRVLSEQTKKRISESLKKRFSMKPKANSMSNKGKTLSIEHKKKISETCIRNNEIRKKNGVKILTDKMKKGLEIGRGISRKSVGKYDLEGKFIEKYNSLSEAAEKNNTGHQQISKVCNGNRAYKTAGGFIWKFLSDDIITS